MLRVKCPNCGTKYKGKKCPSCGRHTDPKMEQQRMNQIGLLILALSILVILLFYRLSIASYIQHMENAIDALLPS